MEIKKKRITKTTSIHTQTQIHYMRVCMCMYARLAEKRCRPFKCQEPTLLTMFVPVTRAHTLCAASVVSLVLVLSLRACWRAFLMHGYYRITLARSLLLQTVGVASQRAEHSKAL